MFEEALQQAIHFAEYTYDRVIRRWGNVQFARSTIYEYVWSEEFLLLCEQLDERQRGQIRLQVMAQFHIKPWSWYPLSRMEPPYER
ncbi:MAG: hypothetical protein CVV27_03755 [Candidatus Melainabacteria bacterium HGW-Melainabacteria-1]|nr:MAG: hypothetical protein CVV27_03755 [Candidatus Melainabacteria bacterium HGW-Melainabacteria-1]